MVHDRFRDLHEASLYTNNPIEALREYHYRRNDALQKTNNEIGSFNKGSVIVHVCSPEFLRSPTTDNVDPGSLLGEHLDWPILKNGDKFEVRSELDHRGIYATREDRLEDRRATTWIDRSGILESISTSVFVDTRKTEDSTSVFVTGKFEESLVNMVQTYINRLRDGTQENTLVTISYVNVESVLIRTTDGPPRNNEIDTSLVRSPVISLDTNNLREELSPVIRPIWNTIGYRKSAHIAEGEWEFES